MAAKDVLLGYEKAGEYLQESGVEPGALLDKKDEQVLIFGKFCFNFCDLLDIIEAAGKTPADPGKFLSKDQLKKMAPASIERLAKAGAKVETEEPKEEKEKVPFRNPVAKLRTSLSDVPKCLHCGQVIKGH